MKRDLCKTHGGARLNVVIIILIVLVAAVVFFPVFVRVPGDRMAVCPSNLLRIAKALKMYCEEYGGTMPSSAINGSRTWDADAYRQFATKRGVIPPTAGRGPVTWAMLLYPYTKHEKLSWCPRDPGNPNADLGFWHNHFADKPKITPDSTVSYWYKAAIDRAWFGGTDKNGNRWACRNEMDFAIPSSQIVFYEHGGWHKDQADKGLSNGVPVRIVFLDGHVSMIRIRDGGNAVGKSDPLAPGEPGWFVVDRATDKELGAGVNYDARYQADR